MEKEFTTKKIISNFFWRFAERSGAQLVSFIVSIILARLLGPDAYGTIAVISVFTSILFVFVDSGLGNALIQKKDADDIDFSTVFYTNVVLCVALYFLLFLCAPFISRFYNSEEMILLIRVSGITLLISGVKNVQQAYVAKKMIFKKFFFATIGGTVGAAFIGIFMAYSGYGVWALVISNLFNNVIDIIILWVTVKWRPKKCYSISRLRILFSYGIRILFANVVQAVYSNAYDLIIGKVYTLADLAYFNKGKQFPGLAVNNVDEAVNSIMLPVISVEQENLNKVKRMTKQALLVNAYIMIPVLFGMAAIAKPLIRFLLTEKWESSTIYLQLFAFIYSLRPINTANLSALKAIGRSDLFFRFEIWKDAIGIFLLFLTIRHGVFVITIGVVIHAVVCVIINSWYSGKLMNYGIFEQIMDIMPILLLSFIMASIVACLTMFGMNDLQTLIMQLSLGIVIYLSGSILLNLEPYMYILNILHSNRK